MPAVDSRLAAEVVPVVPAVRAAGVRVVVVEVVAGLVVVLEAVELAADTGVRAVPIVLFSAAGFPGLVRVLVLREAVDPAVDFFSSSLALTLGRLRWLEVVDAVAGLRTVEVDEDAVVGGRVGGLLRPPVARAAVVEVVGLEEAVTDEPGRRTVVAAAVVPGRLTAEAGFASPGLVSPAVEGGAGLTLGTSCSADSECSLSAIVLV